MNRIGFLVAAAAFSLASISSAAFAADPAPAPRAPASVVYQPVSYWNGFYVGINGGYAFGNASTPGITWGADGGLIGLTVGRNWHTASRLVLGLEGDIDWANIKGSPFAGLESKVDYAGTLRGRLGYDMGRFLPYITAGLAVAHGKISVAGLGDDTNWHLGYALGAGVEYMVTDRWSAKVEYRYSDYQSKTYAPGGVAAPGDFDGSTLLAGLNYRF